MIDPPPQPSPAPFDRLGPGVPAVPLIVSVPHAGRLYPQALLARTALPIETLGMLEDRYADLLVAGLPGRGITVFVARHARAWIDLNRDERELDPAMISPPPRAGATLSSPKVRGGLGLIPRRVAGAGEILDGRLPADEVTARIVADHRPWHMAIATALDQAQMRFGVAMLLDLHSMPPLAPHGGEGMARVVLGDRHGRSITPALVDRAAAVLAAQGLSAVRNTPYAGGYTLDRHGRPGTGRHALQVEIDRTLYLAPDIRTPGAGVARMMRTIETLAAALIETLGTMSGQPLAAE